MFRRERGSLIRERFSSTVATSLAILLLIDGQIRLENVKKTNIAKGDSDDEPVLLMAFENVAGSMVEWWYMDTVCSNYLTGNKQWLVDFDSGKRTQIICVDDEYLDVRGMGNVRMKLNNGKIVLFKDVWYVPGMIAN